MRETADLFLSSLLSAVGGIQLTHDPLHAEETDRRDTRQPGHEQQHLVAREAALRYHVHRSRRSPASIARACCKVQFVSATLAGRAWDTYRHHRVRATAATRANSVSPLTLISISAVVARDSRTDDDDEGEVGPETPGHTSVSTDERHHRGRYHGQRYDARRCTTLMK